MELVIVTGMSGAGKSIVANALEDIGYYCIDNLPPSIIVPILDLSSTGQSELSRLAIVLDIRSGKMFSDLLPTIEKIKNSNIEHKILFLDASDDALVTRYKETRRRHPMSVDVGKTSLSAAVSKERKMLAPIKEIADYTIDTSKTSTSTVKQRIAALFLNNPSDTLNIQCISFGFKNGCVPEADIVFDVRCLKNPFYVPELRPLTGLDKEIVDFVTCLEESKGLKERFFSLLDYSVPLYCNEGKSQLIIAVGCTGGKHRSVVFAEMIHEHLKAMGYNSSVSHRDILKDK